MRIVTDPSGARSHSWNLNPWVWQQALFLAPFGVSEICSSIAALTNVFKTEKDKITQRFTYELLFLLNHMRRKRMWQCFFPSLFYSTYPCSISSPWQIYICSSWCNTLTYMFLIKFWHCVGNSSGFMGSRSVWKNKIWWSLSEGTYRKEVINFWFLLLRIFMHSEWNIH